MIHPAHQHAFVAPVELERLTVLKFEWHIGFAGLAGFITPGPNKVRDSGIPTPIALGHNLQNVPFLLRYSCYRVALRPSGADLPSGYFLQIS